MTDTSPLSRAISEAVPATATGSDATIMIGRAPFDGTVSTVTYAPNSTLTGADTNSRTLSIVNRGQSGSGNTTVASKAFTSGVNATAGDETAITNSGTAANLVVAEGDILAFVSTHVGSGLADPGGLVTIAIQRSYE
jgi:hypothetical protein